MKAYNDVAFQSVPLQLNQQYERLKATSAEALGSAGVAALLSEMTLHARDILRRKRRIQLTSATGESYFSFRGTEQSRPVNSDLYIEEEETLGDSLAAFRNGFSGSTAREIVRTTYSIAFSIFGAHDVYEVGRKASATFFEILIGHIVARALGVSPRKKVQIPESGADLPTDYVFDPGPRSRKIHLPIKTSTRERAVQAWVHQLVLERIFGAGQFRGVLVVASETKRDSRTGDVIEICVPHQLQMFQARVAEMTRVYYLDPPNVYLELATAFPRVDVRSFGEALSDLPQLLDGR